MCKINTNGTEYLRTKEITLRAEESEISSSDLSFEVIFLESDFDYDK